MGASRSRRLRRGARREAHPDRRPRAPGGAEAPRGLALASAASALAVAALVAGCAGRHEPAPAAASLPRARLPSTAAPLASSPSPDDGDDTLVEPGTWYDPAPMLASLRPDAAALADRSGDLPLYDLDLSYAAGGSAFALTETLWFTEREGLPLDEVVLRLYANAPAAAAHHLPPLRFVSGSCQHDRPCTVSSPSPSVVSARFRRPLRPHGRVVVQVKLVGVLEAIDPSRTTMAGQSLGALQGMLGGAADGGSGDYGALAVGDGITSLGGFYAVVARRRGGDWERADASLGGDLGPDEMSYVRTRAALDPGVALASGGAVVRDEETREEGGGGARRHVTLASAMVREVALVSSPDFSVASAEQGGVRVRSFFASSERAAGERVLDAATHALAVFEKRFGSYPYRTLDVAEAALVGGAGGVEYSGLATVASMFYHPASPASPASPDAALSLLGGAGALPPATVDAMREFVVAHEVAHQWWHGLVGSDSRQAPFVDESLAQYSAMLYFEDRYGAARARAAGDLNVKASYQTMRLLGEPDGPVDRPVAGESAASYAGLVYGKGPYYYAALRKRLGDARFFDVVRRYVAAHRFGFAGPEDFTRLAATSAGPDAPAVWALARRWLREAHGDEDLGKPDLGGLLGNMMGGAHPDASALERMLRSGDGGVAPGAGGLDELLRGLSP